MSAFLDGIGVLLGKAGTFIPGRIEKIKNEKQRLIDECKKIMDKPATDDGALRVIVINKRVSEINSILGNKATD